MRSLHIQPMTAWYTEAVREESRVGESSMRGDHTIASILKTLADMPLEEAEKWVQVYNQSGCSFDTADRTSNANQLSGWDLLNHWGMKLP